MSDLVWDKRGWGFLPLGDGCSKDYWQEYRKLDATPMGRVLTALRAGLVDHFVNSGAPIVDVGIGGGAFVEAMDRNAPGCGYCKGADVDRQALAWLQERGAKWESRHVSAMTLWDSLEHIEIPRAYLEKARHHVFISTPIYEDADHCMHSKHYKPGEHCWYFEDRGLKAFMRDVGFECMYQDNIEEDAGREGIGTYVFRRA